jgi:23S rRNA (cytosine1962-C5)-methyltransferase
LTGVPITLPFEANSLSHSRYRTELTDYPSIRLRNKEEKRLIQGHLWAFSNELVEIRKDLAPGSIVRLERENDGSLIGLAFYNHQSLIAARIISRKDAEINDEFWKARLSAAAKRREPLLGRRNAARLVHGESDFLPGLIIDRFNDVISFQIASVGFEVMKQDLIHYIDELWLPRVIVEKNQTNLRKLEGLDLITKVHKGDSSATEIIDELNTRYQLEIETGQKTGFFLDQMENRTAIRRFTKPGDRCIDLFANEGGFAINMALAGAESVLAVDASAQALQRTLANAEINGVKNNIQTEVADCFDFLKAHQAQYDVVVLDPPALVKSKKDLAAARKGYLQLNADSMRITKPEGILFTASCSHHVSRDMLLDVINDAARRSRRQVTVLEERGAGIDHPILLAMPETQYLKVFILRIH